MQISPNILTLDIKVQDKFREMLSKRDGNFPKLTGVILGDSDIDYNTLDQTQSRILNSPFNVNKIKYPLVYSGSENGLEGNITCFARHIVDGDTNVSSLYSYPPTISYSEGTVPPVLNNGFDWNTLPFNENKQGYILFYQTLLLNYYDPNTNEQMRLNEPMSINVTFNGSMNVPTGWEVIIDNNTTPIVIGSNTINCHNNSMMISRDISGVSTVGVNSNGLITVKGLLSNITKVISFNI